MLYSNINKILHVWRESQETHQKYINKTNESISESKNKIILDIIDNHNLQYAVVERNDKGELCITSVKFLGSNGKECSIKSSLLELYQILDSLDKEENILASFVMDVNIDNLDDLYSFAITVILK